MFFKQLKSNKKISARELVTRVYLITGGCENTRQAKITQLMRNDKSLLRDIYTSENETAIVFSYNQRDFKEMTFQKAKKLAGSLKLNADFSIDTSKQNDEPKYGTITLPPDYNPGNENSAITHRNFHIRAEEKQTRMNFE